MDGPGGPAGSEFFHTAKDMIKDAFKDFRQDIRDSFRDLGFDTGIARKIAKGVIHAAKDALKSGADFSAKLMVAAVSQTHSISAAGSTSSFNMVASSIEVTINHSTKTVEVNTANVTIDAQVSSTLAAPQPHLVDIHDSEQQDLTGSLLAPQDLANILDEEEAEAADEPAPVTPAVTTTAREAVNNSLASVEETETPEESTARTAVDAVLESAAKDEAAATDETEEAAAAEEAEEAAEEDTKLVLDLPEIFTPLLLSRPEYSARIFITAYEHSINDRHERITFMRFDAIMPLTTKPAETADETPAVTPPAEVPAVEATVEKPAVVVPTSETPVVETTEEETETETTESQVV